MNIKLLLKRIIFYFMSFSWGIIMSTIGLILILILALFRKVHIFHGRLYAVVGKDWGGVGLGCFFLCDKNCKDSNYLRAHECGHTIQNCIFGPFAIFLIFIPSVIRYWYRKLKYSRNKIAPKTGYYDIWFEKQASDWGNKYILTDKI